MIKNDFLVSNADENGIFPDYMVVILILSRFSLLYFALHIYHTYQSIKR